MKTNIITEGYMLAVSEHTGRGALAAWVRKNVLAGNWQEVAQSYGDLERDYGKRKNTKTEQTPSTPADSMRACIHNVTSALVGQEGYHAQGALKPVKVDSQWGLEDKGPKSTPKPKKVEQVCAKFASQFKTEATKKAALIATARAMGIEIKF